MITLSQSNQEVRNRSGFGPAMWRNESADKIFPEILSPQINTQSDGTDPKLAQWKRLGISQKTGCNDGLTGTLAQVAEERGCKAVLRATYVGAGGNYVATVALIALPEGDKPADKMADYFDTDWDEDPVRNGVHALAVHETPASGWEDGNRNGCSGAAALGVHLPYGIAASAGSVDGRQAGKIPGNKYVRPEDDRIPWREAARTLAEDLNLYLGDLLTEETSP